jgi:hypothetical protein
VGEEWRRGLVPPLPRRLEEHRVVAVPSRVRSGDRNARSQGTGAYLRHSHWTVEPRMGP